MELESLRRAAAQAQEKPTRENIATRAKAQALQEEFNIKTGLRRKIADKARDLLGKASADPRLADAAADSAVEAVLSKNPQVAQLDAELLRISDELKELVPPGLCALTKPSKNYGYVREINAMPIVEALQKGNERAQRIAALIIEADRELRFLTDQELSAIGTELAAGEQNAEGAHLRASAARIMRDFQGTIVEGAKESIADKEPGTLSPAGALASEQVAQAFWEELRHLLRLSHYAAAAAVAAYTDDQVLIRSILRPCAQFPCLGACSLITFAHLSFAYLTHA